MTHPSPEARPSPCPPICSRRLRVEARALGVPIEWLVASLIVDTVDSLDAVPEPVAA